MQNAKRPYLKRKYSTKHIFHVSKYVYLVETQANVVFYHMFIQLMFLLHLNNTGTVRLIKY